MNPLAIVQPRGFGAVLDREVIYLRAFRSTLFLFLFLSIPLFGNEGELFKKNGESPAPPQPLELKGNWWQYFEVPSDRIEGRVDSYSKYLNELLSSYSKEDNGELVDLKGDILNQLKLYESVMQREFPSSLPALEIQRAYTIDQILELKKRSLDSEGEIAAIGDKLALKSTREGMIQYELDREVVNYNTLHDGSYEKLYSGLRVIYLRLQLAVIQREVENLNALLSYRKKELERSNSILKDALRKVDYSHLKKEAIEKVEEKNLLKLKEEKARRAELERMIASKDKNEIEYELVCCLKNYQLVSSNIRIDNLTLLLLLGKVKLALYAIATEGKEIDLNPLKDVIAEAEDGIAKIGDDLDHWSRQLMREREEVSRAISLKMEKAEKLDEGKKQEIVDIHIELDQAEVAIREAHQNIVAIETLVQLLRESIIEEKSITDAWGMRLLNYWQLFTRELYELFTISLWHIDDRPITALTVLKALLVIALFLFISTYLKRWFSEKILSSPRFSKATKQIAQKLIHYATLAVAFMIALNIIGIDLTNIAILAGALGIGIGFGLQPIIINIISGFTLLLNRYLKVGDIIQTEKGEFATVKSINLQFTHISTFEGADMIIPNADLSTRGLVNWTMKNELRRYRVPFGVAYGTDKDRLRELLLQAVNKEPYVIKNQVKIPNPDIWFMNYGDSSMNFELVAWVDLSIPQPHGMAISSLLWVIDNVLTSEGIEIPFPQRDLHVKELPKKTAEVT